MTTLLAGVDLGGTNIKAALASQNGEIVTTRSIPTESHLGPEGVLDRIADLVKELAASQNASVAALGMGVPGLVDTPAGVTRFLPNLPTQWRDIPAGAKLSAAIGCPVRLLNDVRTATLAELRFGHGRDEPTISLAFFSLGTGVGGGISIDGRLRLGPLGAAGELGHLTVLPGGPRCGCGDRGCLETLASGPAISAEGIRLMRSGLAPGLYELVNGEASRVSTREMVQAAKTDKAVREAITNAATFVGIAAANLITIFHPSMIVLGGGVAEIGELLTSTVKRVINESVRMFPTDDIRVEKSYLGDQAGVKGAIALAREALEGEALGQ